MNPDTHINDSLALLFSEMADPIFRLAPAITTVAPKARLHASDKAVSRLLNSVGPADISGRSTANALGSFACPLKLCHCKRKRSNGMSETLLCKVNMGKDVVKGKGETVKRINEHFICLVRRYCDDYCAASNNGEKREVARSVMKEVADNGGRFLDAKGDELDKKQAFTKVMKSLKDARRSYSKMAGNQIKRAKAGSSANRSQPTHARRVTEDELYNHARMDNHHEWTLSGAAMPTKVRWNDVNGVGNNGMLVDGNSREEKTMTTENFTFGDDEASFSGVSTYLGDKAEFLNWWDDDATAAAAADTLEWVARGGLTNARLD